MDKVGSMQEQMGSVSREMKILGGRGAKEMLQITNTLTEVRNAFEGLISRLYTVREEALS